MPPQSKKLRPSPATHPIPLHPNIWRACAGSSVQIPAVNSRVYYFPQGHLEHAYFPSPSLSFSPLLLSKPSIPCRVASLDLLADHVTDEVFAKFLLYPISSRFGDAHHDSYNASAEIEAIGDENLLSFAKILTPSDANNGGGFSVPRLCADTIFPSLNYDDDPPVQTLSITDVHGVVWQFRHIYRGTPRRHLLTTGWSKFVNSKKLVAGDSVVFMRNAKGEMFVGVRRTFKFNTGNNDGNSDRWTRTVAQEKEEIVTERFSRNGREKTSAKAVGETAELAAQDMPFEVVYYPRVGWSDFVVKAEVVEEAMNRDWSPGTRIRMSMETEDSSRLSWIQGTISSVFLSENGPWWNSPWRMLQVNWDEPEVLQNTKRVNPWQVDYVSLQFPLQTFPSARKLRASQGFGMRIDGEGESSFPLTAATTSIMGHFNQSSFHYDTFPAGMQGARQDILCVSSSSNLSRENTPHFSTNDSNGNNTVQKLKDVSTELSIGGSQFDHLSPDSQSSMHSFGSEFIGAHGSNSKKLGTGSFQLFGKVIQIKQPAESGSHGGLGCTGVGDSKGENDTEVGVSPPDLSLTYMKLLDVQFQIPSGIEESYL